MRSISSSRSEEPRSAAGRAIAEGARLSTYEPDPAALVTVFVSANEFEARELYANPARHAVYLVE